MKRIALAALGMSLATAAAAQLPETKTTMANPAATFCVENGGTYEIRDDGEGNKLGYCILPDGAEVDAWDFIRSHFDEN